MARLMHLRRSRAIRLGVHVDVPRLWRITCHSDDSVQEGTVWEGAACDAVAGAEGDDEEFNVLERFCLHLPMCASPFRFSLPALGNLPN